MVCREPEKGTVFYWRAKLKEEEKDNDPKNMWKKFDSAGPMKAISVRQSLGSLQYPRLCAFSTFCIVQTDGQIYSRHMI